MKPKLKISERVFKGRIEIKNKLVSFKFPKTILRDINLDKQIYAISIDGVIQITGKHPNSIIPVATFSKENFVAH